MTKRPGRKVYFTPEKKAEIRRKYYGATVREPIYARIIGFPNFPPVVYRNRIREFAEANVRNSTTAEKELLRILLSLNGGALRGRLQIQYPISGKWIVDFFFPENRLAIELDGSVHLTKQQKGRDREKEDDCKRFDITLIRIRNYEVYGNRSDLIEKLRDGWRAARERNSSTIGVMYKPQR